MWHGSKVLPLSIAVWQKPEIANATQNGDICDTADQNTQAVIDPSWYCASREHLSFAWHIRKICAPNYLQCTTMLQLVVSAARSTMLLMVLREAYAHAQACWITACSTNAFWGNTLLKISAEVHEMLYEVPAHVYWCSIIWTTEIQQSQQTQYLNTVDVKNTLWRRNELEVDDMRQRPHTIIGYQCLQQLGFDCGNDQTWGALRQFFTMFSTQFSTHETSAFLPCMHVPLFEKASVCTTRLSQKQANGFDMCKRGYRHKEHKWVCSVMASHLAA